MKKTAAPVGLCANCRHVSGCTFPRDSRRAVFECEEFESLGARTSNVRESARIKRPPRSDRDAARHAGLCRDCENRKHCALMDNEGGVWHCEEYR